ncbi:hypothetical protein GALMADRAFT_230042 [Galerina marginata CBS 339.88]|uniref:Uncharacterized protein n=1 Tax=Galerina marginata (strain CBS 339.88) TaxID=685588 RepID=A0A067SUA0_GALM3|nr:hypothetical protein GALMADRAFT_230042 [Galerina marginata CBS 339.88]
MLCRLLWLLAGQGAPPPPAYSSTSSPSFAQRATEEALLLFRLENVDPDHSPLIISNPTKHSEVKFPGLQFTTNIDTNLKFHLSADALTFGSVMLEGTDTRISGQDVGHRTFSHRHAMLVNQKKWA